MTATILYGAPVREKIKEDLIERVKKLEIKPFLAIVQVGDRADSNVYVRNKVKFGEEIGVGVKIFRLEEEKELIQKVKELNEDKDVNGIIVQLPLPEGFDTEKVLNTIDNRKDADGLLSDFSSSPVQKCLASLTEVSTRNFSAEKYPCISGQGTKENQKVIPATARGVMELLDFYKIAIAGKKITVIGRSKLAGGPIAKVLKEKGAEVTICHRGTKNMAQVCKDSEILISAAGQIGLVTRDFVKEGQVIIDVGINKVPPPNPPLTLRGGPEEKTKIVGDVVFDEVKSIVSSITPVPGGVGPLTVACLFKNLLDLNIR